MNSSKQTSAKQQRLEAVNELINVIAAHGRKFFWCPKNKRFGYFMIDTRGCLYWRDEWSGKFIYMSRDTIVSQRDIHHGHTLRSCLKFLAKYIRTGDKGNPNLNLATSHWGYDEKSLAAVNQKAEEVISNV